MSVEHITAVMKLKVGKSTLKYLLFVLANMAHPETDEFYPSIKYLEEKTELNRKTILAGLKELQVMGIIEDTGKRDGLTNQVVVYRFLLNRAEIGTVPKTEQSQKVTETVPIFPENSTVFSVKQSQKRDTETKGNKKETKGKDIKGSRIPENWRPSPSDCSYCASRIRDKPIDEVVDAFRDYWIADSSSRSVKRDWSAAFRTWVRNAVDFSRSGRSSRPNQQRSTYEQTMEVAQRAKAMIFGESYAEN